ncbi:helix-turn-helix domain-containing protein [Paraclostridium ghonii]|uniref:transposase n=1 Tax=Paraclostridium ghonii TaxID=29358 RepID=UPI00202CE3DA|nr:helix-turn-helix domain-containing protein [Paeniclostridium ghonii]MCM0167852.1 helix-turn-helix domain-containing protein [Paeniclostridium ghonii]
MCKKYNKYSKELKLKAIDMYINEGMSPASVARALDIKNKTQVKRWVDLYNSKGKSAFDEETRGKANGPRKGRPKTKFNSVEEELNYLRMENEFLKKLYTLSEKKR